MQLQIDQTLPAQVRCPGCQALFTVGATAAGAPPQQPAPAPSSPFEYPDEPVIQRRRPVRRRSVAPWVVGSLGVLAAVGVVVAVVVLRGGGKAEEKEETGWTSKARAGTPDTRDLEIQAAIARGVGYLKKRLLEGTPEYHFNDPGAGSALGVVGLSGLTLLECGVPQTDPAVQKAVETVRLEAPRLRFTYALALSILFLDRYLEGQERPDPADRELIRTFAVQLMTWQKPNGGWGYYCDPLTPEDHAKALKLINAGKSFPQRNDGNDQDDNSINQFVTLALWAARKYDVKTESCLKAIDNRYRKNQNDDGSWGYRARDKGPFRDATTCAGLIGLAVGRGADKEKLEKDKAHANDPIMKEDPAKDPAIAKALKYVGRVIGRDPRRLAEAERQRRLKHTAELQALQKKWHTAEVEKRSGIAKQIQKLDSLMIERKEGGTYFGSDAIGDLYFLWSVERVAVLFDLKKIDGHEWYDWGARIILANQKPDGSWRDRFPGMADTCFALLFLKRANVAKDLTDKLRTVTAPPGIGAAPEPRLPQPAAPLGRARNA